ncbi:hypothetical protein ATO6_15500 [Oceanicola sp. 22II-s10i]|nr:hypothetical protein ATO6_15500 [Oceanicola sp. 22II-s10i]
MRVRVEGNPNRKIVLSIGLDHPHFSEHYYAARAGQKINPKAETAAVPRSLDWLKDKYLAHLERMVAAGQASPSTLRQRRSLLTRLCAHKTDVGDRYGEKTLEAPQSAFVRVRDAMAATPAEADNMMKAAKSMYAWADSSGYADANPVVGISRIHKSRGGAKPWTGADLLKFRKAHPPGTMAHLALTLHMFTACRSSDAIWLGRDQEFIKDGVRWLEFQPRKKGSAFVQIPMMPQLRASIAAAGRIGPSYVLSEHGRPYRNPESYRMRFRRWCDEAGLVDRSSHGIRKAMSELLAEAGCSEHQIMAVTSHTQPSTSAIYTRRADRARMAAQAMAAAEGLEW